MKITRKVTGQSSSVEMTDELYDKLSKSQQLIAAIGEALNLKVKIASYEGRNYVSGETVDAIATALS